MKLRTLILFFLLLPAAAPAEDEVSFGRLFMEPGTREQLDESRKQNSSAQRLPAPEEIDDTAVTVLRMNGVVMRRDGSTEVWVNGVRSDSRLAVQSAGANRFQVAVPGGGVVTLKPGQVYSFESQRVIEGYEADKELTKELGAGLKAEEASQQNSGSASTAVKTESTQQQSQPGAANTQGGGQVDGFNEAELGNQDFPIKLEQSDEAEK